MSDFKGTPGPWAWGHNTASSDVIHCIDVTAKDGIGSVAYLQSYTADDYDDRAETIANARLIAAAPELLEALRRVLSSQTIKNPDPDSDPDVIFARAAIAKAIGEQS